MKKKLGLLNLLSLYQQINISDLIWAHIYYIVDTKNIIGHSYPKHMGHTKKNQRTLSFDM